MTDRFPDDPVNDTSKLRSGLIEALRLAEANLHRDHETADAIWDVIQHDTIYRNRLIAGMSILFLLAAGSHGEDPQVHIDAARRDLDAILAQIRP